ncbi:hypothetical protein D3C77_779890 [compost metagenome]
MAVADIITSEQAALKLLLRVNSVRKRFAEQAVQKADMTDCDLEAVYTGCLKRCNRQCHYLGIRFS